MKTRIVFALVSAIVMLVANGALGRPDQAQGPITSIRMPYGERPAPSEPEPFAPHVFSSVNGRYELHLHSSLYFSHDGKKVFFAHQDRPVVPHRSTTIMQMERTDGLWSPPEIAPFASDYSDQPGWFSPDGKRFYFGSVRPVTPNGEPERYLRMWIVDMNEYGWSAPTYIRSFSQLTIDHGPMYLPDTREGGHGGSDVYRIQFEKDFYSDAVNIGEPVNSGAQDYPVLVGPDERYLIIYRTDRWNRAVTGLYISFRVHDAWTEPTRMAGEIGAGFDASLSPDGLALFFLKRNDDVFWVDARIIDDMSTQGGE